MKKILFTMFFLIGAVGFTTLVKAQNTERVNASYLLAFGRLPSSGELSYWNGQGQRSVQQLVDNHKNYIKSNQASVGKDVIIKSYIDALGYRPSQAEIDYHSRFGRTYAEMMNAHMNFLRGSKDAYQQVVWRSMEVTYGRKGKVGEWAYWSSRSNVYAYSYLVACHLDNIRKYGTSVDSKIENFAVTSQMTKLQTTPVSRSVLNETKTTLSNLVAAGGGNLVAAGGGNLVAAGAGNLVAAGGGNLVAAGAGN